MVSDVPSSMTSSSFAPVVFSHNFSVKLDNHNFLLWKPQVLAAIREYMLEDYIDPDYTPPLKFLTDADRVAGNIIRPILNGSYKMIFSFLGFYPQYLQPFLLELLAQTPRLRFGVFLTLTLLLKLMLRSINFTLN